MDRHCRRWIYALGKPRGTGKVTNRFVPRGLIKNFPAPVAGRGDKASIDVPQNGVGVRIVLIGGTTEVGEQTLRSERRISETQTDVFVAGRLGGADPAGADFDVMQCST
jgi:hypothetical protein